MWAYIDSTRDQIYDLWHRLQNAISNVDKIVEIGDTWQVPLFERREAKAENLIDLDNKSERINKRYEAIRKNGETIHQLIKVTLISKGSSVHDLVGKLIFGVFQRKTNCC